MSSTEALTATPPNKKRKLSVAGDEEQVIQPFTTLIYLSTTLIYLPRIVIYNYIDSNNYLMIPIHYNCGP